MELNKLSTPSGATKKRKRVGRGPGSGNGKTSGRGHKGQQARSGYSRNYGFEGGQMPLHRRLPKRGFNHGDRWPQAIINLDVLEAKVEAGSEVSQASLVEAGLIKETTGGVKVLGRGEVTKKLNLKVQAISPSAKEKIEAAGGTVEITSLKTAAKAPVEE